MEEGTKGIKQYVRAANYLSAAQIYLQNNFLLENALSADDVKSRLLGHWGTCPGINFVYAHLNHLINETGADMLFVMGPGHGLPALQANLFLEGTLGKYYPEATRDARGIAYIAKNFSWPYGFPSHSNPGTPGVILEGGELGYALATSYGAALDNPDLIVACLIGDGEAETGPTAAAWHINKLIDPAGNGAVLPILHLNGYKISGPTIFGRMSDGELISLFSGYGYEPHIVEGRQVYEDMRRTLKTCYESIRGIQKSARDGARTDAPRFPMIILKTPKGWTGIEELHGEKIAGNHLSHQVVAPNAKTDPAELSALEEWLRSYRFEELFSRENGFSPDVLRAVPEEARRMGDSAHAHGGSAAYRPLILPKAEQFAEDATVPGTMGSSSMRRAGEYVNEVFRLNKPYRNFRLMSPDETYSNKLDKVFETTARAFTWPREPWDKDLAPDGRVMEILSEHSLQGLLQGYVLTGRHGVFASYEAFIQIIASMADQYAKFLNATRGIPWRGAIPSLNYILTSSGWRQEHNGFSHQNPGFVDDMLQRQGCFVNVYFPPDGNSTLVALERALNSKNEINIIVASKRFEPRWLTPELARKELMEGLMIWEFASDPDPDIVIAGAGDYLTKEALAAVDIIKKEAPEIRVRFVNIMALSALGLGHSECSVALHNFEDYFTHDKPVIFNFHGYPQTLKQILFDYGNTQGRFSVHGYQEHGSTTTPFDMHVRNATSRYHLAIEAFEKMAAAGVLAEGKKEDLVGAYHEKLKAHRVYIERHGVDPDDIEQWQWKRPVS